MAFSYFKTITIDRTQCGSVDSSNFPVYVAITDVDLRHTSSSGKVQSLSGYDICPYDAARTTALDFQLISYSPSTGAVVMHVRIPTLTVGSDTVFTLCFGDATLTTPYPTPSAVWRSEYKVVAHLNDNAASTTVLDSTSNANHATNAVNTSGKTVAGQLGSALTYNGSSDLTTFPNIAALHGVNQISFSCWVKFNALGDYLPIMQESSSDNIEQFGMILGGAGVGANTSLVPTFSTAGGFTVYGYTSALLSTGVWYHLVVTYDASQSTLATKVHQYMNAVDRALTFPGASPPTTPIAVGSDPIRLGRDAGTRFTNYVVDEVRAYAGVLSPSWITAEYNNQRTQTGTGDFFKTISATLATTIFGTLTQTLATATLSATGAVAVAGSLSQALAPATLSSAGTVVVAGSLAQALAPAVLSATGVVPVTGALALALAPVTLSATGSGASPAVLGALDALLAPLTLAATGQVAVAGTLARTLDALSLSATGVVTTSPPIFGRLIVTLAPVQLFSYAYLTTPPSYCGTTTLPELQALMVQRWDGSVFWTADEATTAINDALRLWNLLTGYWRTRQAINVRHGQPEVDLPGTMSYGMRVAVSTSSGLLGLTPSSYAELDLGHPQWRLEWAGSAPGVPARPLIWAPLSLTRIAIWPMPATTATLVVDGIMQTPYVYNFPPGGGIGSPDILLTEDLIDPLVDMALHLVAFKEGGARWRATRPFFETFLQAAADENSTLKTNQRFRRWAGLDRRRDLQPSTGAPNQVEGLVTQFSRHDQTDPGGG